MSTDLPVRCTCGALRGVARGVSPERGNRLVCYCDDCQSFAYFLDAADRVLDAHGGTEIFQTSAARLEITDGAEHLACVRLTPGGLHRWYTDCCRAPVGNTLGTRQMPFVGLIRNGTDGDDASDARARKEALGPVRFRVNARFARGDRTQLDAHDRGPASLVGRFLWIIAKARLGGDHLRSPFFDAAGKTVVTPRVLTPDELREVEAARDA